MGCLPSPGLPGPRLPSTTKKSARFLGTLHNVLTKLIHNGELHEMAHFEEAQDARC